MDLDLYFRFHRNRMSVESRMVWRRSLSQIRTSCQTTSGITLFASSITVTSKDNFSVLLKVEIKADYD